MGTFSVTKVVTGVESVDNEFAFSYTCDNNVKGTLKVKADGSVASGPELPVGTKCTIAEDAQSAQVEGYAWEAPASQEVTISEKEQAVLVTFTNAYTPEPKPEPSPSPTPSATPTPSETPTPGETPDPSESSTPVPSGSPSPGPSGTPTPSDPATPGAPSSPSATPPAAPSGPAKPQEPSGGPLASTGVRIGLPLGIVVVALMGGALLVSRRRA